MRKFILLIAALTGATVIASAQNKIVYEYDASGNRIARRVCAASYTNKTVNTATTVMACDNITVQQVTVNATLTIGATGVITLKNITMGNSGKLILDTQGSGRVVVDERYDLSSGYFEIK